MIGVIPSGNKTYEILGSFESEKLVEGKLYYRPKDNRLYYYSKIETRSNPNTGYFPVWNGSRVFESNFSNRKYFDKDTIITDVNNLAISINNSVAKNIIYNQRKSTNGSLLKPEIKDEDNMFTQCIKSVICAMDITMVDLFDMCAPKLSEKVIENYYSALTKISFMRLDRWNIWLNTILHMSYVLEVYNGDRKLLTYSYPSDTFDTGIVKYDNIIQTADDPYKKIVKVLMVMENITKSTLKTDEIDDYTINNMMTTLGSKKPLSAQLFSRFIRMANLAYTITIYDKDKVMFEYKEQGGN